MRHRTCADTMRVACTNTRLACRQVVEDPFGEERTERKARITAQEGRQLKNMKASDQVHGKPALPPTLKLAASLPEHGKGVPTKRRELKTDVSLLHYNPVLWVVPSCHTSLLLARSACWPVLLHIHVCLVTQQTSYPLAHASSSSRRTPV